MPFALQKYRQKHNLQGSIKENVMLRFLRFLDRISGTVGGILQSPLLLVLRLFFGVLFIMAGFSKLQDIDAFTNNLTTLGIPYPEVGAWLTSLSETVGGAFLVIGFLSRLVVLPLIIVMSVAYSTAHVEALHAITTNPKLFVDQPPFNFLLTSLLVWAFGPGFFSVDQFLGKKVEPKETPKEK